MRLESIINPFTSKDSRPLHWDGRKPWKYEHMFLRKKRKSYSLVRVILVIEVKESIKVHASGKILTADGVKKFI